MKHEPYLFGPRRQPRRNHILFIRWQMADHLSIEQEKGEKDDERNRNQWQGRHEVWGCVDCTITFGVYDIARTMFDDNQSPPNQHSPVLLQVVPWPTTWPCEGQHRGVQKVDESEKTKRVTPWWLRWTGRDLRQALQRRVQDGLPRFTGTSSIAIGDVTDRLSAYCYANTWTRTVQDHTCIKTFLIRYVQYERCPAAFGKKVFHLTSITAFSSAKRIYCKCWEDLIPSTIQKANIITMAINLDSILVMIHSWNATLYCCGLMSHLSWWLSASSHVKVGDLSVKSTCWAKENHMIHVMSISLSLNHDVSYGATSW